MVTAESIAIAKSQSNNDNESRFLQLLVKVIGGFG